MVLIKSDRRLRSELPFVIDHSPGSLKGCDKYINARVDRQIDDMVDRPIDDMVDGRLT